MICPPSLPRLSEPISYLPLLYSRLSKPLSSLMLLEPTKDAPCCSLGSLSLPLGLYANITFTERSSLNTLLKITLFSMNPWAPYPPNFSS